MNSFYRLAEKFLNELGAEIQSKQIELPAHWDIDHLCYQCGSQTEYQKLKTELACLQENILLSEAEIGGRAIASFQVGKGLELFSCRIDVLELSAPKPGKSVSAGYFDHIEIVCDIPFADLQQTYPQLQFGLSDRVFNQELKVSLKTGRLKFHHQSLRSVIELENNEKVFSAIRLSACFEKLAQYSPLVAGTFPLGISLKGSDIDLLLGGELAKVKKDLISLFGNFGQFQLSEERVEGEPTLLINFLYEGVPFEIFAQAQHPVKQRGYRHFLIEERLLKYGGPDFCQKVRELRNSGLKTEPAFAAALGLKGDPFLELLRLQQLDHQAIASLF